MALLDAKVVFQTPGPLSLAVYEVSNVTTGDTVDVSGEFTHLKNAVFFPVTTRIWEEDADTRAATHTANSLTVLTINQTDLDAESGWLVVVGGT